MSEFMANLEQCESRILDAQSVKLMFSLKVADLTKTESITKKSLTQLSHYLFE